MVEKENDILVRVEDKYGDSCLVDSVNKRIDSTDRKPQGHVEIYEITKDGKKQLIQKSNLVLYVGRLLITQRILDLTNASESIDKDGFVCWLGLGRGGTNPSDPLDPVSPTMSDTDLNTEVPISPTDSTCADFHDGAFYKHPFDDVTYQQDVNNDNTPLIAQITTTIGITDAENQQVSEAGLFSATSRAGGHSGVFSLFSRVTFPTILKTTANQLVFVWYLYF